MSISFFDDFDRTFEGPAEYAEAHFPYLNRSTRPELVEARSFLDAWFVAYSRRHSASAAKDLRKRLRSLDDEHHLGALTELYTHNLIAQHRYRVRVHPPLKGRTSSPDFLALRGRLPAFYAEATIVSDGRHKSRVQKFQRSVLDSVNQLSSPDFFICVNFVRSDTKIPPAVGKMRRELQAKVEHLDYSEVRRKIERGEPGPRWNWDNDGWSIKFEVRPVMKEEIRSRRDASSRVIGTISYPGEFLDLDERIKTAVERKLNKYGPLDHPFVVVVNIISEADGIFVDDDTIMEALFGKETVTFTRYPDGTHTSKPGRTFEGILVNPKIGIKGTRMSGLLILKGLAAHNLKTAKSQLWVNPKAKHPLRVGRLKIPHMVYDETNDRMERVEP